MRNLGNPQEHTANCAPLEREPCLGITDKIIRKALDAARRVPTGARIGEIRRVAFVYVMKCGKFVKVGIAADVNRRRKSLYCGNPFPIEIAHARRVPASHAEIIERLAHDLLAGWHHRLEWFDCDLTTATDVVDFASDVIEDPIYRDARSAKEIATLMRFKTENTTARARLHPIAHNL